MYRTRVFVRKEHVENNLSTYYGLRSNTCPIALALQDHGFRNAGVGSSLATFEDSLGNRHEIQLSYKVEAFINAADQNRWSREDKSYRPVKLKPFSFLIEIREK